MDRETQLDTHEIDKLLADEDFIDDFDFSEDLSDQFVDLDEHLDDGFEDDLEGESEPALDEPVAEESSSKGDAGGAGVDFPEDVTEDVTASVALEFDKFGFASFGVFKSVIQNFKIVVVVALILWLAQLFGILFLLKQPVTIRDEIRPLTAETDLSRSPQANSEKSLVLADGMALAANPHEPDIFLFSLYLPLYSLDGLKVFSAAIEVTQFQETGRLTVEGQKQLQDSLRLLLQDAIGERLHEEIVDVEAHLTSMIIPHIENFFSDRKVDMSKINIRVDNPDVQ